MIHPNPMRMALLAFAMSLCLAALGIAGYAVWTQLNTGRHDRNLITELICASIDLREDFETPDAAEWRMRVDNILVRYDESCSGGN
jgi:hypothetical protein